MIQLKRITNSDSIDSINLSDGQLCADLTNISNGVTLKIGDGVSSYSSLPYITDPTKLPLTGGTLTGSLIIDNNYLFIRLPSTAASGLQQQKYFNDVLHTGYISMNGTTTPNIGIVLQQTQPNIKTLNSIELTSVQTNLVRTLVMNLASESWRAFSMNKLMPNGSASDYVGAFGMQTDSSGNPINTYFEYYNQKYSTGNALYLYSDRTVMERALVVASGGTGANNPIDAKTNLGMHKLLYNGVASGIWTTGSITVPEMQDYWVYLIQLEGSIHRVVCLNENSTTVEGIGGASSASSQFIYTITFNMNASNVLSNLNIKATTHKSGGNHDVTSSTGVRYIWGLI